MAKRKRPVRRARQPERNTNWILIGGVVVAVVAVLALLALAFRDPGGSSSGSLMQYCQDNPDNCISRGSEDAEVAIAEVSDYGCVHCKNFNLETAGLIEDLYVTPGDVRWINVPYALGIGTALSAEAAFCAADQGRFEDFHFRMFQLQGAPGLFERDGLVQVANELGMDGDSFGACIDDGRYSDTVQSNIRAAGSGGINTTPTFVINDRVFPGNRPLTFFQEQIAQSLGTADEN